MAKTIDGKRTDLVVAEALRKAIQLCTICCDWNLEEVEIDGEMVSTRELSDEFEAARSFLSNLKGAE